MRQKYNVFDKTKITKPVIAEALKIKKQHGKMDKAVLTDPDSNLVPVYDDKKFYAWVCAKYLNLSYEDGLPILKQAYRNVYNINDTHKLCKYCGKAFPFTRSTKEFCDHKCQMRFKRWGPRKQTTAVTIRQKTTDKENSNFGVSGSLPLKQNLSVTENGGDAR